MILQLAKLTTQDENDVVIILKDHANTEYSFVKPIVELDTRDKYSVDNGSIQMALWTVAKDEYTIIKGASFDTSVLPKLQQMSLSDFINL
jgi:hypothetical protein